MLIQRRRKYEVWQFSRPSLLLNFLSPITLFFSSPTKWALRKMTSQKTDHGEKQRELEVVDQCEYKCYSLLPPTCSLSHDGERQAWPEANVPPGKENEFWITSGDRFPELLWSPAQTRARDQQAGPPMKTGLRSSLKQLSAHKGVYQPCIGPGLCPAPGPLSFDPKESFSSPPKTELSWHLKMSKCEARLHIGLCWGFVSARQLGGEDCISRLFLNPDFWNLIWKNTITKTRNSSPESPVALGVLFRWLATSESGQEPKECWAGREQKGRGVSAVPESVLFSIPGGGNATPTWYSTLALAACHGSTAHLAQKDPGGLHLWNRTGS